MIVLADNADVIGNPPDRRELKSRPASRTAPSPARSNPRERWSCRRLRRSAEGPIEWPAHSRMFRTATVSSSSIGRGARRRACLQRTATTTRTTSVASYGSIATNCGGSPMPWRRTPRGVREAEQNAGGEDAEGHATSKDHGHERDESPARSPVRSGHDLGRVTNAMMAAREFKEEGDEVELVFDGAGTRWPGVLADPEHSSHGLYESVSDRIAGACGFCADAFEATEDVRRARSGRGSGG